MATLSHVARNHVGPVVAAVISAYLFTWGVTSLGIIALAFAGASFHAAETGMMLVAFPLMLTVFLWSFISVRPGPVKLALIGAGVLMMLIAWALQPLLID